MIKHKKVPDTSDIHPMIKTGLILQGLSGMNPPGMIEAQEHRGQTDMVNSTQLPKDGTVGKEELFSQMGITLGPVTDDIFRDADLPPGWKKKPTEHSMWSELLDANGSVRGMIFYKAAFYDRSSRMRLTRRYELQKDYDNKDDSFDRFSLYDNKTRVKISTKDYPLDQSIKNWEARDLVRQSAVTELLAEFPDYEDVSAYWSD